MGFFQNDNYNILCNKISLLKLTDYTDQDIINMKDVITGLFLKGSLSDEECSSLLLLLPSMRTDNGSQQEDEPAYVEKEESSSFNLGETKRFYSESKPEDEMPEEKKAVSFEAIANNNVARFFNTRESKTQDSVISDEDTVYEKKKEKSTGFDSFANSITTRFFNSKESQVQDSIIDDDDEVYEKKPQKSFSFDDFANSFK